MLTFNIFLRSVSLKISHRAKCSRSNFRHERDGKAPFSLGINQCSILIRCSQKNKIRSRNNIKLIGLPIYYYKFCAAVIGMLFDVIAILIVFTIEIDIDIMVVIAALFICIGTGRQIFASALDVVTTNLNAFLSSWASTLLLLAKNRLMVTTTDWRSIEVESS